MAAIERVDTDIGAGDNDGTSWANAWRTDPTALVSALASCDAGGRIYIKSACDHLFTGTVFLSSANGVANNPVTIISVKAAAAETPVPGDYETMMDGGGNLDAKTNGNYDIILRGWDIWKGLKFMTGDDFYNCDNFIDVKLINCKIILGNQINIGGLGNGDCMASWENVDLEQANIGNIGIFSSFRWTKGSFSFKGGSTSTSFLALSSNRGGKIILEDIDIQDLDAGDYLVNDVNSAYDVLMKRCKIPAAANYMNAGPTGAACKVRFHSTSSADNTYNFKEYYFEGMIEEATNCKLTGDWSAKMITDKGNTIEWSRPLRFKLAEIYAAANATVTVNIIHDEQGSGTGSDLQDDEFWIEVESPLASAQLMRGQITSSRPATILTAPQDLANNAEGWIEDLANEVKQEAEVTVGGGGPGIYTVWACLAIEATVYVDPIPVIS